MRIGQFCINKESLYIWKIAQIKPLVISEVCGPMKNRFLEINLNEFDDNFFLVDQNTTQEKCIKMTLDNVGINSLNEIRLKWCVEKSNVNIVNNSLNKASKKINGMDIEIETRRTIAAIKALSFNENLEELKEVMSQDKKIVRLKDTDHQVRAGLSVDNKEKSDNKYIILEPNQRYNLENVILAPETKVQMEKVILKLELGNFLDEEWGLSEVSESSSRQPLNFQGPPGTGKTLAAKCIATKLNKKILQVDYATLISHWAGKSGKNIQGCFQKAQDEDMILLFDEADAILTSRHQNSNNSESTMNQNIFMQELDKFKGIVILTTNFFQKYDEALLRRFNHVQFKLPTPEQRQELFKIHIPSKIKLKDNFNWSALVQESPDFSGGDIKNVIEQALSTKAIKLRNENKTLLVEEFKKILRSAIFNEDDFLFEIDLIKNNKDIFKNGISVKNKKSVGLIT